VSSKLKSLVNLTLANNILKGSIPKHFYNFVSSWLQ